MVRVRHTFLYKSSPEITEAQLLCNLIICDYLKLLGNILQIDLILLSTNVFTIVLSTQLQSSQPLQSALSSQR